MNVNIYGSYTELYCKKENLLTFFTLTYRVLFTKYKVLRGVLVVFPSVSKDRGIQLSAEALIFARDKVW